MEMCKKHTWAYKDNCSICKDDADTEKHGLTEIKKELQIWYYENNTKDWDKETHDRYGSEVQEDFEIWFKGYKFRSLEISDLKDIIELKEQERHQWSLMCIKKQARIEQLEEKILIMQQQPK